MEWLETYYVNPFERKMIHFLIKKKILHIPEKSQLPKVQSLF